MRTNIEIDDRLMARVMRLTGLPTKRAVVEEGLKLLVQVRKQAQAFKTLRGIGWEGDLDEMRRDQPPGGVVILVDSSVWIAHLRGPWTASTAKLEAAIRREPILVGDHILFEVLQGARDEAHAARIERGLCHFEIVPLLDAELAPRAARNYRKLRTLGVTVRKTADIIIGTYCIENRCALLHDDRDFAPMVAHLGLVAA